jgi:hypothetical protein
MCGGQGIEEGWREAMYVGCRHAVGGKSMNGGWEAGKGKKDPGLMCALVRPVCLGLHSTVENLSKESCVADFP